MLVYESDRMDVLTVSLKFQQSITSDHPVQPPVPSLPGPHRHHRHQHQQTQYGLAGSGPVISTSSSGGMIANTNSGTASKRSSPLNYFSLDIPASLTGSSVSPTSLPHQSCSLPFVARLVRTPSNSSGQGESFDHQPPQQVRHFANETHSPIKVSYYAGC